MSKRREVLIDAYNVMFAHPSVGRLARSNMEQAREEFLVVVGQSRPPDGSRIVVVFDAHRDPAPATSKGRQGKSSVQGLQVIFARETADEWIKRRIREHATPAQLTIVTSDREILATARAHGSQILRVRQFLGLPASRRARAERLRQTEKPEHVSKREIEKWERLFEEKRDED